MGWKSLVFCAVILGMIGCASRKHEMNDTFASPFVTPFAQATGEFFRDFEKLDPGFALGLGLHQYDDQLAIPNEEFRAREKAFFEKYRQIFASFDVKRLSASELIDYHLLLNFIDRSLWHESTLREWEWDPSVYNLGSSVALVLESPKKSEKEKILAVSKKMVLFPAYYQAALKNIKAPTLEHLALAIKQSKGFVGYLKGDVQAKAKVLGGNEATTFAKNLQGAVSAVESYVQELEKMQDMAIKKSAKSDHQSRVANRSFRLGKKLYEEKFKFDLQSSFTAEEIYQRALKAKKETHLEMAKRAKELWPKYFPKQKPPADSLKMIKTLITKIAEGHVKAEAFVSEIRQQVPRLWDFVVAKDLMTLDPDKRLQVRETPVYERGFAGASVDAPGPFDEDRETFYNVTPLTDMTPDQQESYLREYNNYSLQILNIHEAIPGHYVQLVYGLKSPSLVKKVFGNGTMVEGWAVYSERMMLEQGYGDNSPELWLMYYKWRLRVISNTILDYSIHNLNMNRRQALDLMVREAFQEQEEAEKKWTRATISQVQLVSYFAGFTEIYEFREEMKKKMGDKFNLKNFHEKFLSYGSAPIKYIKEEMRKDLK